MVLMTGLALVQTPLKAQLVSGIDEGFSDPSVEIGNDFYERVNGGWLEKTEIPPDKSNYGSFSVLDDEAKDQIRVIIEAAAKDTNATGPTQQVGALYSSYMNVAKRNSEGIAPIQSVIDKIQSIETKSDWMRVAGELDRIGVGQIFGEYVNVDAKAPDQYTVYMGQGGTTLPDRDYYLVEEDQYIEVLKKFEAYVADMLEIVGHENPAAAATSIVELEKRFAESQWTRVELRDPNATYNKKSTAEVKQMLSAMDFEVFANEVGLADQPDWIIGQPSYFEKANAIFGDTDLATLKDFLLFSAIDSSAPFLTEAIEKRHFDFHQTVLSGVAEQKPLWRRGVELCNGLLGMPVGQMYVEQHFPPVAKQRMEVLVDNLKQAFALRIQKLEWMGPGTKKQALEKLNSFTTKIGYPDQWKDYSSVKLSSDSLIENLQTISEFEHQYQLNKLGSPIDRSEWFMPPQTVNAYYNPTMNEIVFPAAILQPPFFNMDADDAVNYGGIGAVIGHEISHGFDDKGSQYDGKGQLRNWWTEEDRTEFEARAKQLVDQYAAYKPFEDMNVNGELTLGENIGDLGGLNVALEAYKMSLQGKPAPEIDGMTGMQRFFTGWAQVWRRKYLEPELRQRLLVDPHSPSRYRCNGIVANMDEFYEAFGVTEGELFIPKEQRVRIW